MVIYAYNTIICLCFQGVGKAISIDKMLEAGCKVKIWIADWFAMLNNKMGGNLDQIRTVGLYMIEIWKALGMNVDGVEFLWASEEIEKRGDEYWSLVMDISQKRNFKRIVRYTYSHLQFVFLQMS